MHTKVSANPLALRRWIRQCETTLANHSDRINAINVFPVADADTGSNLYMTMKAARLGMDAVPDAETDLGALLAAGAAAAMESAMGNSGTLLSVVLTAMAEPLRGKGRMGGADFAAALQRAQIRSWTALSEPVNGTMLSVIAAAAHAAATADAASNGDDSNVALKMALESVVEAACAALARTEEELGALSEAQLVDAGGVGIVLVLECLRAEILHDEVRGDLLDAMPGYQPGYAHSVNELPVTPGVEVMCLITLTALDAATLRMKLDEIGDSVIMSSVAEIEAGHTYKWRVHVHCEEAETALNLFRGLGEPENVAVTALSPEGLEREGVSPEGLESAESLPGHSEESNDESVTAGGYEH